MNLRSLETIILLLLTATFSFGQFETIPDAYGTPMRSKSGNPIDGNMYSTAEWARGAIHWKSGSVSENLLMKYNTYTGKLELRKDGDTWEYSDSHINRFQYDVVLYPDVITTNFVSAKQFLPTEKGFVKMLFESKVCVFEVISTEIVSGTASYGTSQSTDRVIQKSELYIKFPVNDPVPVKLKNATLVKTVAKLDSSIRLKEFISLNSLNISRENDLKTVLNFLDGHFK
jgi:hypothetical protein